MLRPSHRETLPHTRLPAVTFAGRCRRLAVAAAALGGAVAAGCADETGSVATKDVGLVGGDESVWAYQYRIEGENRTRVLRLACWRENRKPKQARFVKPRELDAVLGEVSAAAVCGASLHVVYADGTHRRYHPAGETVERNLPKSCVPLVLAGDEALDVLYALVPTGVASKLPVPTAEPGPRGRPTTSAEIGAPLESTAAPEPAEPSPAPATPFAVVRYERGIWCRDRDAPKMLHERRPCRLVARDGVCHLFITATSPQKRISCLRSGQDGWSEAQVAPEVGPDEILGVAARDGGAVLLVKKGGPAGGADPYLILYKDGKFERGPTLGGAGQAVAVTVSGQQVAVGFLDEARRLAVGRWSIGGGAPVVASDSVDALVPKPRPWASNRLPFLAYGALAVMLVLVFARRRDSLLVPARLAATQTLATYPRRFAAFVLDVLIMLPPMATAVWPLLPVSPESELSLSQTKPLLQAMAPELLLPWLVGASLFVVYATVFEAAMGATPGKRLLQCRIVDEQGRPCRLRAILLRNLVRLVEMFPAFQLMPAVVLIIVTRNRQRLGDLIARTVVVELTPPTLPRSQRDSANPPPGG